MIQKFEEKNYVYIFVVSYNPEFCFFDFCFSFLVRVVSLKRILMLETRRPVRRSERNPKQRSYNLKNLSSTNTGSLHLDDMFFYILTASHVKTIELCEWCIKFQSFKKFCFHVLLYHYCIFWI
ncbi:elongation factor 1-alpha-like [Iris pallida]|uniref:Elongation factor 1-alpha-like n=1 Tax=Iris pallida TaxID=29817 RepID=A0AAX6FBS2_IRIPA|nr:elongation factor 1-alpha-like [Iris pallida]